MPQYTVIWEFEVKPDKISEFEKVYGPAGEWVRLFRQGNGFLRADLIKDIEQSNRYVVLDHWQSREQYLAFREAFISDYEIHHEQSRALTVRQKFIGAFEDKMRVLSPCST